MNKFRKQYINFFKGVICFTGGFGFPWPLNIIMWFAAGIFFTLSLISQKMED